MAFQFSNIRDTFTPVTMANFSESIHDEKHVQVNFSHVGELPGPRFDASFPPPVDSVFVSDNHRYPGVELFLYIARLGFALCG